MHNTTQVSVKVIGDMYKWNIYTPLVSNTLKSDEIKLIILPTFAYFTEKTDKLLTFS